MISEWNKFDVSLSVCCLHKSLMFLYHKWEDRPCWNQVRSHSSYWVQYVPIWTPESNYTALLARSYNQVVIRRTYNNLLPCHGRILSHGDEGVGSVIKISLLSQSYFQRPTETESCFSYLALQRRCAFDFFDHFWSKTQALHQTGEQWPRIVNI